MTLKFRGGWPFRHPPNTQFRLNTKSPQANGLLFWIPTLGGRGSVLRDFAKGDTGSFNNGPVWKVHPELDWMVQYDRNANTYTGIFANMPDFGDEDFSVSFWFQSADNHTGYIFSKNYGGATVPWYGGYIGSSNEAPFYSHLTAISVDDGTTRSFTDQQDFVVPGTLYHVVGVRDTTADLLYQYVNGVYQTQAADNTGSVSNSNGGMIGNRFDLTGTRDFGGLIGDLRIYNRVLHNSEIWQMYDPATRWELYQPIPRMFPVGRVPGVARTPRHPAQYNTLAIY